MPNLRLLINLLKKTPIKKRVGALKKVPISKWTGDIEGLSPTLGRKVKFDGIQEKVFRSPSGGIGIKPGFYQFTDKKSGSTFLVPLEEDINFGVWERLQKIEKSYKAKSTSKVFSKPKWDPDSQSYKFEVKGQLQEIYKDPESKMWFDAQRLTPGSQTRPLYLGDTKIEATKKSTDLAIENIKELQKYLKKDLGGN